MNFLIDGVIRLAAYATFGFFQDGVLLAAIGALPAVALGLWIGGHIHTELSQKTYLKVISVILLISGTGLIVKNWGG